MKTIIINISLFILLLFYTNIGLAQDLEDNELIGSTVLVVIEKFDLQFDEYFVIDEPPGVPRGIIGKTPKGETIKIYIRRGDVPFSENMEWELSEFEDKKVIDIIHSESNNCK